MQGPIKSLLMPSGGRRAPVHAWKTGFDLKDFQPLRMRPSIKAGLIPDDQMGFNDCVIKLKRPRLMPLRALSRTARCS